MESVYAISILVHVRGRATFQKIKQAVTDASIDIEDALMGVQSFHVNEVKHKKNDCDVCGGTCIGADA